jgi:hypothetical protein
VDTLAVLKRNLLTVGLHSAATYLYDLDGFPGKAGWWGRPAAKPESEAIWALVQATATRLWPADGGGSGGTLVEVALPLEVALIVDDISSSYFEAVGGPIPAADPDNGFSSLLQYMLAHALSRTGIPFRNYLLADLRLPSFQSEVLPSLKLIIFANTLRVPAPVRAYIKGALTGGGRTLLWLWAPNAVQDDSGGGSSTGPTFDPSGPANITGLPLVMGSGGAISLQADIAGFAFPYFGYSGYKVAPWFTVAKQATGVKVLASYHTNKLPAVVSAMLGGGPTRHTMIFSGAVKLPTEVYTKIAVAAGCHPYVKTTSDIVDTGGSGGALMLVAGDPKLKAARTVTLPAKAAKVEDGSDLVGNKTKLVCTACTSFETPVLAPEGVALFWVTM